jgi:nitrile hydratase accessory protein
MPSDSNVPAEALVALPSLPRDGDEPVFAAPWQAQVFALAVELSEQGHFSWQEWAAALADEIKHHANASETDDGSTYYHHWLAALERLVSAKGLSDPRSLRVRKDAWADAYRHTPHGKPVTLTGSPTLPPASKRDAG